MKWNICSCAVSPHGDAEQRCSPSPATYLHEDAKFSSLGGKLTSTGRPSCLSGGGASPEVKDAEGVENDVVSLAPTEVTNYLSKPLVDVLQR